MNYVLSVVHPPEAPAAYGKAVTFDPVGTLEAVQCRIEHILTQEGVEWSIAASFGLAVLTADSGWEITDQGTGFTFRIDPTDNAPHPCPCCGRLVLPDDHADAHMEGAYCTGCFTWNRGDVQCLPANTAHPEES